MKLIAFLICLAIFATGVLVGGVVGIAVGADSQRTKAVEILENALECEKSYFRCQLELAWCPKVGV